MSGDVVRGRFTTANDEGVVLFTFGVRVNRFRDVRGWWPAARSLVAMLRELRREPDPDSGLLASRIQLSGRREIVLAQYWRSVDELLAFAGRPVHGTGFKAFHRAAARGGTVGLWHELLVVPAGHHESIYGFVPRSGLATFLPVTTVRRRKDSARARLVLSPPPGAPSKTVVEPRKGA